MTKCYQIALSKLRTRHDKEFHAILSEVYEEEGIVVRKRNSRQAAAQRRIDEARAILEAAGVEVS
jgi:hypothetical protein